MKPMCSASAMFYSEQWESPCERLGFGGFGWGSRAGLGWGGGGGGQGHKYYERLVIASLFFFSFLVFSSFFRFVFSWSRWGGWVGGGCL